MATLTKQRLGHGDLIQWKDSNGKQRTAVVAIVPDEGMGAPWKEHDGHGPVSDWTTRSKRPGELVLNEDRGSFRYYDFAEACRIALRDGWDAEPYSTSESPHERAAKAARADYERLREWCNDEWQWVGVVLFELPDDEMGRDPRHIADEAPFGVLEHEALWGIESDSPEYHDEVARELVERFA